MIFSGCAGGLPPAPFAFFGGRRGVPGKPALRVPGGGAGFFGRRLTLSLWYSAGGLGGWGCRSALPLACFAAPIPPTPFPAGRGRILVDFAGGFAPGTPAAEPIGLRKTDKKRSLRVIPPPAGDRDGKVIRQRRGKPPSARDTPPLFRCARVQPPGTCSARSVSAAGGSAQGCRGRSPRRNNLWGSPFPAGEGGWGDRGQKRTLKAGQGGDKEGKRPPPYLNFTKPIRPADCRSAFFCV